MEVVILRIANNHESADDMNECCEPQLSVKSSYSPFLKKNFLVNWKVIKAYALPTHFCPCIGPGIFEEGLLASAPGQDLGEVSHKSSQLDAYGRHPEQLLWPSSPNQLLIYSELRHAWYNEWDCGAGEGLRSTKWSRIKVQRRSNSTIVGTHTRRSNLEDHFSTFLNR